MSQQEDLHNTFRRAGCLCLRTNIVQHGLRDFEEWCLGGREPCSVFVPWGPSCHNLPWVCDSVHGQFSQNLQCAVLQKHTESLKIGRITSIWFSLSLSLTASPVEKPREAQILVSKVTDLRGWERLSRWPSSREKERGSQGPSQTAQREQSRWEYVGKDLISKTLRGRKDSEGVKGRQVEVKRRGEQRGKRCLWLNVAKELLNGAIKHAVKGPFRCDWF